jgi:hypothetical protein
MMTRRCTRFGSASLPALVGDVEQGRLLGGKEAVWSDDRFAPAMLLLRPARERLSVLVLGESRDRFCR